LTYRRTTVADLPLLIDHRHRMWTDIAHHTEAQISDHDIRYRPWAKRRLVSGELTGVVVETGDGSPVASGLVWFRAEQPRPDFQGFESPYILSMFTEPAWRGRGIATRIVRELVTICRERGFPNVGLHASRFGRPIYRRVGFERTWEMRRWIGRPFVPKPAPGARAAGRRKKKGLDRGR
jgi:GNAT superfamily N-acetyltransferase